jgi:hypothetical protein
MTTAIADNGRTVIPTTPPPGWEREVPKYRVVFDTYPAPKARYRTEAPFTNGTESDCWQYGSRTLKSGEVIESREWPHPMFFPLNYSAKRVLDFFNSQMKSRLARSPFFENELRLETGLSGDLPKIIVAPQVQRMDLRPVRF